MLRPVLAVVVAYIAMNALILGGFAALLIAALLFGPGPDRLLRPGSWQGGVSLTVAAPGITLGAGLLGGWFCATIARRRAAVIAMAALVLLLGGLTAVFTLQKPAPTGPREPGLTVAEFREKGREPTWLVLLNPVLGAAAVLAGGLLIARPRARA